MNKKNIIQATVVALSMILACGYTYIGDSKTPVVDSEIELTNRTAAGVISCIDIPDWDDVEVAEPEVVVVAEEEPVDTEEDIVEEVYFDGLDIMACAVQAEAGNQPYLGKVKVAKVILNRVTSEKFPDTIEEVIYAPYQFTVVSNGSINSAIPTDEIFEACRQAMSECSADPYGDFILYFQAGGYFDWAIPAYQIGDHYFCY